MYFCCLLLICSTIFVEMSPSKGIATFEDVKNAKDDKNVLLIDVREPSELVEFGEVAGSVNIPLNQIENALKDLPEKEFKIQYGVNKPALDFPIIFTCRSGRRSGLAQDIALKLGYTNVRNYAGGWLDYEQKIKN